MPAWIVFELVITKLPHYVLPLYPAIAILIAGVLEQRMLTRKAWLMPGLSWWFFAPVILSVLVITGSIMLIRKPETVPVAVSWKTMYRTRIFRALSAS